MDEQHLWAPRPRTAPRPSRWGQFVGLAAGLLATALLAASCWFGFHAGHQRPDRPSAGVGILRQMGHGHSLPTFGSTELHDACAVIKIQDLNGLGVPLSENEPVVQQRVDGSVLPEAAITQSPADAAHCSYPLANGNTLTVTVHQTPFTAAADLDFLKQAGYRAGATLKTESDLSLAQWHDKQSDAQRLNAWKQDILIDVSIGTSKPWPANGMDAPTLATKLEPLVTTAIITGPIGHTEHFYEDPFSRLRDPCESANYAAFDRAFPSHAGVSSIVRGTYHPTRSQSDVLMSCRRSNIVRGGSLNEVEHRELLVEFSVADSPQAARAENARFCSGSEVVDATPSAGHARSCLVKSGTDWALWFQLDQVNIRVSTPGLGGTAEEVGDRVVPAALAIVEFGVNH
ncbi:hypothetical protein ACFOWZ_07675 [Lentzea rhizosphaerae]|uniref:PASTA domain-containing protein n=1 Tax=Lentzea rhizosphaerae TaxID=2041025 RepID=A0ABV8BPS3_9PSEU